MKIVRTKKFKRVHKIKKYFWSQILGLKLWVRMSNKAYRCLKKLGSFDRYILLTPPRQMDSKIGEYYRTLMLRKINDPEYRIPYVIGSGKKTKIHSHQRYKWIQRGSKIIIPKEQRAKLITNQRPFGTNLDQLVDADYQKFLEVERLKKLWGKDMDNNHPLLLQIKQKLQIKLTQQQISAMNEMAQQFKRQYLENPKNRELRNLSYQYNEKQAEKEHLKTKEAWIKHDAGEDLENAS